MGHIEFFDMNVLYTNFLLEKHVYAMHMARAYELSEKKEGFKILMCDRFLKSCEVNVNGSKLRCNLCIKRVNQIAKKTNSQIVKLRDIDNFITTQKSDSISGEGKCNDSQNNVYEELKKSSIGTIATYEHVSTVERISKFGKNCHEKLFQESKRLYQTIQWLPLYLSNEIIDTELSSSLNINVFNGRYATALPFYFIAKEANNVDFYALEIWGRKSPHVAKNRLIHDPQYIFNNAIKSYKALNLIESKKIAKEYFDLRWEAGGESTGEKTFIDKQKVEDKSLFIGNKALKISIFPSSNFEYNFLPYGYDPVVQDEELENFISHFVRHGHSVEIIIRLHPNLSISPVVEYSAFRSLSHMSNEHVLVRTIDPQSSMSTYQLIKESDFVVSFASFTAVEANYLRKKVVQIGPSRYRYFDISNQFENGIQAAEAIIDGRIVRKKIMGSVIFACGFMCRGDHMKEYSFDGNRLMVGKLLIKDSLIEKLFLLITSYISSNSKSFISYLSKFIRRYI